MTVKIARLRHGEPITNHTETGHRALANATRATAAAGLGGGRSR